MITSLLTVAAHVPIRHLIGTPWIGQVTEGTYNSIPYVRSTLLKHMVTSPLHFKHAEESGYLSSRAMGLGVIGHAAVLEPGRFKDEFLAFTGKIRRGKKWEAFQKENAGLALISQAELEFATSISEAVQNSDAAQKLLARIGHTEVTMCWVNAETGLKCKARVDHLSGRTLTGLKTARSVSPDRFALQAYRLNYHLSWAMYADGFRTVTGEEPEMYEIAVENAPPWDVVPYRIGYEFMAQGDDLYRQSMRRLAECRATGKWPGQGAESQRLDPPAWAGSDDDDVEIGLG